ncbi:MAG: hypothetical protein HYY26_02590 [Acidobacteria bacterium]|nr:hypothetical protein [Acidobacteriota bacterium]
MNRWYAHRRWIYLGLAALLAVDAAVYWGWVSRPVGETQPDPAALAALEEEVAGLGAEVARLRRVVEQAPRMGPQLEGFVRERLWVEQAGFSGAAAELEETAREAGVRVGRATYETLEEKEQPDVRRVEIATSIEGNYPNLLRYLEALERSPHFYLISELRVSSSEERQVRLEMKLATYFRSRG